MPSEVRQAGEGRGRQGSQMSHRIVRSRSPCMLSGVVYKIWTLPISKLSTCCRLPPPAPERPSGVVLGVQ